MASHPPSKCCIVGVKHEGEAVGTVEKVGGYDAYITYPKDGSSKNAVIIFPDFMGYELINARLIADQLAANGYFTIIPDIWLGDNVPLNWNPSRQFNLGQWMGKHGPDTVMPIAEAAIKAMREDYGVEKLGGVGYCLGAKYVCRFLAEGKGLDVGFIAHPTAVTSEEVRGLGGPLAIAAAETDDLFPAPKRHETEAILKDMDVPYQISLYSDVDHGFAFKADLKDAKVRFATETAFLQAVNLFDHFVKAG
ncbi:uncharacterized protein LTR77_003832 [Saxophila tyrrhenica]|uniref:Dienelactone hydrolase domain-containing protein n=1 Tax=Saxophila tyrrhenica TaxID=1690608 RepID=A0AAV9PJ27_9PEZI|nr:hypothetical protein LTR77_003832 [Saxophila tyrrhenica]